MKNVPTVQIDDQKIKLFIIDEATPVADGMREAIERWLRLEKQSGQKYRNIPLEPISSKRRKKRSGKREK